MVIKSRKNIDVTENEVAVITGGARGIGRAVAQRHAAEGAAVILADRLREAAREAATMTEAIL